MRCLMLSPVPPYPATQGNAVLVGRMADMLQASGCDVHFVYLAMEGAEPENLRAMARSWSAFDVVPYPGLQAEPGIRGYPLDSWYAPEVDDQIRRLCSVWHFDFAMVHYVWMSAAFNAMPADLPKVLVTHDRFGERHRLLTQSGIAPTWYSVSSEDEAIGLNRADIVVAAQREEALYFSSISRRPVMDIGFAQALCQARVRTSAGGPFRAGFLGSANPGNVRSILLLVEAIERCSSLTEGAFELLIAGPVCGALADRDMPRFCRLLGHADRPADLFEKVDVMVNPSVGGSGIKIKAVEALASGVPLMSTRDGSSGIDSDFPNLNCEDADSIVKLISDIIAGEASVFDDGYGNVISQYMERHVSGLSSLLNWVSARNRNFAASQAVS